MARFWEFVANFTEDIFVSLELYADETGIHDPTGKERGAEIAGIAGYIARVSDWAAFCGDWQEVLTHYKVSFFHFSDFAHESVCRKDKNSPYHHLNRSQRHTFLNDLATVANAHTQNGCCVVGFFLVQDYDRIMPEWFKQIHPHYGVGFRVLYESILVEFEKRWRKDDGQVAIFLDHNPSRPQWARTAYQWYRMTKTYRDKNDRLGAITLGDSKKLLPLQAADMVAYFLRQQQTNKFLGRPVSNNEFTRALGRNRSNTNIQFCDSNYLRRVASSLEKKKTELIEAHKEEFGGNKT